MSEKSICSKWKSCIVIIGPKPSYHRHVPIQLHKEYFELVRQRINKRYAIRKVEIGTIDHPKVCVFNLDGDWDTASELTSIILEDWEYISEFDGASSL